MTDAYITWSLTEAGGRDLQAEIDRQAALARDTEDPYLLALATQTLFNAPGLEGEAKAAAKRLRGLQADDGHWAGSGHSITRSGGQNLQIETTALGGLALLRDPAHRAGAQLGVAWLMANRGGHGQWGTTQATILTLRALTTWSNQAKAAQGPGSVLLRVNGKVAGSVAYEAGRRDPIVFEGLAEHFTAGAQK